MIKALKNKMKPTELKVKKSQTSVIFGRAIKTKHINAPRIIGSNHPFNLVAIELFFFTENLR